MNPLLEAGARDGWIYFVQVSSGGSLKIGWAKDPSKRIKILQTSHPKPLRMLGVVPGTRSDERALHKRFAHARKSGEWFDRSAILNDVMGMILEAGFQTVNVGKSRNSTGENRAGEYCLLVTEA